MRLITGNTGKFKEIRSHLEGKGIDLLQEDFDFVEVQADTLEEVVLHGLQDYTARMGTGVAVMKDDSGLFIDALGGFPGVYSAYVLRTISNKGILKLMEGVADRGAVFRTAIGMFEPEKGIGIYRGEVRGNITLAERGRLGFGFDPIFQPVGEGRTFAEMTVADKNTMSHRIRALRSLLDHLGDER
jgi:XTP/dITP diphosphohydrolase